MASDKNSRALCTIRVQEYDDGHAAQKKVSFSNSP